jgi:hypothetical protein
MAFVHLCWISIPQGKFSVLQGEEQPLILSVADPDPDPYVFGLLGPDPDPSVIDTVHIMIRLRIFLLSSKNSRKNVDSYIFVTS